MTTESTNNGSADTPDSAANSGNLRPQDAPVLAPRPVYRPHVDAETADTFGRPSGQSGSFGPPPEHTEPTPGPGAAEEGPPPAVLAEAFGRPRDSSERLQRDPDATDTNEPAAGPDDPWRDPDAGARLGGPALSQRQQQLDAEATKLSARDVLFGGRVAPKALAVLAALAIVIGLISGIAGRMTAETAAALTSDSVELEQTEGSPPKGEVGKVADAVLPAVVSIRTTVGDNGATGSGVVIDGAGYIVTNNHVVSMAAMDKNNQSRIQVSFVNGERVDANIVGRDPKSDLAVIKVIGEVKDLTKANLGKSENVQVGDDVVAIGSPLGLSETVTSGIVSALHRPVKLEGEGSDTKAVIDAVQTDAAINPGNSGGALVNMEGQVVGINTAIRSESGGSIGLGFSIPVDRMTKIAQTLIREGDIHHPVIGLSARSQSVSNESMSGAEVADVQPGSPAEQAGIVEGDIVVGIGERAVTGPDELVVAVQSNAIGDTVDVHLVRDGREIVEPVTLESD